MTTTTTTDIESGPSYERAPPEGSENDDGLSETTPLLSGSSSTLKTRLARVKREPVISVVAACLLAILLGGLVSFFLYPASSLDHSHQEARERWQREMQEHEKQVSQWNDTIASYKKEESELIEHLGVIRNETERRIQENGKLSEENDRLRNETEALEERADRARENEKDSLGRWTEYVERLRREKAERAKLNLHWTDILGDDKCLAHDRIHYRALLANMIPELDPVEACKDTSIKINGILYQSPEWCEDVGNSNVYGHWTVENETKCLSYWDAFKDKNCTAPGSGLRRFEATLGGVQSGQDPEKLCHTTPASILGRTFDRPTSCPYSRWSGYWGVWDVEDESCA